MAQYSVGESELQNYKQGFDLIGTYLPTTRSFLPISSFLIDDSRVGTAESAREDIGGNSSQYSPQSGISVRYPKIT